MFGRRTIRDSLTAFNDFTDKNGDSVMESDTNYIYYNKEEGIFEGKIEVYVNYEEKSILVVTNLESPMEDFLIQIADAFRNSPEYYDLENIQVTKLFKSISTDNFIEIPINGNVQQHLKTGDKLVCDLSMDEFWNTVEFELRSKVMKRTIQVKYKLSKKLKMYKWKLLLLKCGIDLFIDQISKDLKMNYHFNYYVEEVIYKINNSQQKLTDVLDKDQVQKHMSVTTKITVTIQFSIFEELMYNGIKSLKFPPNSPNIRRFNEMKDTPFDGFIEEGNFQPEFHFIKNIINNLIISESVNKNSNIIFYTKKHSENENPFIKRNKTANNFIDISDSSSEDELNSQESITKHDISNNENSVPQTNIEIYHQKMIIVIIEQKNKNIYPRPRTNTTRAAPFQTSKHRWKVGTSPVKSPMKKNPKACKSFGEIAEGNDEALLVNEGHSEGLCIIDNKGYSNEQEQSETKIKRRNRREATFVQSDKHTFLENVRDCSRIVNLVEDFRVKFSSEEIYIYIQNKQKFKLKEDLFKKMIVPQSRDIFISSQGNNENEFEKNLWKLEEENIKISNQHVLIFIVIVMLYFGFILFVINSDLYNYSK